MAQKTTVKAGWNTCEKQGIVTQFLIQKSILRKHKKNETVKWALWKPKIFMPSKIYSLNCKYWIAENSKGLFFLTEHLIFVSILRIHLGKFEKLKLHIDKLGLDIYILILVYSGSVLSRQ